MKSSSDIRRESSDLFTQKGDGFRSNNVHFFDSAEKNLFNLVTGIRFIHKSSITHSAGNFGQELFRKIHGIGNTDNNQF